MGAFIYGGVFFWGLFVFSTRRTIYLSRQNICVRKVGASFYDDNIFICTAKRAIL